MATIPSNPLVSVPVTETPKRSRRDKSKSKHIHSQSKYPPQSQITQTSTAQIGESSTSGSSKQLIPSPSATPLKTKARRKKSAVAKVDAHQSEKADSSSSWECIPIAQSEVTRIPPVWSRDGRFYFVVSNNAVHIHSSTAPTFTRLSTLSSSHPKGHRKPITSLTLSPSNPLQLITSSQDGTVKFWDWVEGRLVRTIILAQDGAVNHICVGQYLGKWSIFAAITTVKKRASEGATYKIVRTPLSSSSSSTASSSSEKSNPSHLVGKLSGPPEALIISPRSTYLVALALNKAYTYRLVPSPSSALTETLASPAPARPTCVKFVTDQNLTCGAFAPEKLLAGSDSQEEWFATGDSKGVIRLWHGLGDAFRQLDAITSSAHGTSDALDQDKRLPTTSLHWHAHAVAAIAFTSSGAQLLSVGEESVLVQWHLVSGKREYIPRLGGRPIVSLAVRPGGRGGEEEWWMGLSDGSVIRVGAASGSISNVGQGIRLDPLRPLSIASSSTDNTAPYPLVLHPSTQSLVVPSSHPSTLQFIDPLASSVLFDLEVAPSNRISRRDEKELDPVAVERVAFSQNQNGISKWMATMEGRKGDEVEGGGMVKNLKIWKWTGDKYVVNTQYPRPHGVSEISSITFSQIPSFSDTYSSSKPSPSSSGNPYLLTTGNDGTAKIWNVRQAKNTEHGKSSAKKPAAVELFWAVRSAFTYRSKPIYSACFSPDCTLIALAHGAIITLWDVESNVLLKVLDSAAVDSVRRIGFVGSSGRYLAGTGASKGVALWDLLSCRVEWASAAQPADTLLTSPSSTLLITSHTASDINKGTSISIFSTSSSPRLVTLPIKVRELCHLPSHPNKLLFAGVSATGEIYRFGDPSALLASESKQAKSLQSDVNTPGKTSIWQEMFGKDAFIEDLDVTTDRDLAGSNTATGSAFQQRIVGRSGKPIDVFEGPSHTLPPVSIMFDAFMDELLSGHTAEKEEAAEHVETGDDEIIYQTEEIVDVPAAPGQADEGRTVGAAEIAELEIFFKQVLGNASNAPPSTLSTLVNGDKPLLANGVNGHGSSAHKSTTTRTSNGSLLNGHLQYPEEKNKAQLITPNKVSSVSTTLPVDVLEEEDEGREIDGTSAEGSAKKKGKKRRAPKDI